MTPKQAIAFVKTNGVVLESGRGPVPNLAEAIAGEPIRASWWAHRKANTIFLCARAISQPVHDSLLAYGPSISH